MIAHLSIRDPDIVVTADEPGLEPRHENQLAFWNFKFIPEVDEFVCTPVPNQYSTVTVWTPTLSFTLIQKKK